jgi:ribosomal protein L11 methyltransferase
LQVSDRLWVCFPWSEFDRTIAPTVVEIDPGRAFGTGGHPSTALLLAELDARLRGGESVLDIGCGSGVLAVCAASLGAARVTALDVRDVAVDMTRTNAARNGVAERVDASKRSVSDLDEVFDVVVANIGAPTLIDLASDVEARSASGGWIGLSGLSPAQVSMVAAAYRQVNVVATPQLDDWSAVIALRNERPGSPG